MKPVYIRDFKFWQHWGLGRGTAMETVLQLLASQGCCWTDGHRPCPQHHITGALLPFQVTPQNDNLFHNWAIYGLPGPWRTLYLSRLVCVYMSWLTLLRRFRTKPLWLSWPALASLAQAWYLLYHFIFHGTNEETPVERTYVSAAMPAYRRAGLWNPDWFSLKSNPYSVLLTRTQMSSAS